MITAWLIITVEPGVGGTPPQVDGLDQFPLATEVVCDWTWKKQKRISRVDKVDFTLMILFLICKKGLEYCKVN